MKKMVHRLFTLTPVALAVMISSSSYAATADVADNKLAARSVQILTVDNQQFKDLNKNGKLDGYEDWRNAVDVRINDLVSQMTLEEKIGMMLIDTMNAGAYGKTDKDTENYVNDQLMTRFIFRNAILPQDEIEALPKEKRAPEGLTTTSWGSAPISPKEAAEYLNAVQEMREKTRLGIPALFKSNARNHNDPNAKPGINVSAGAFSEWPKEAGLAATRDMELIGEFANIMQTEWNAIGLRGMYGYMADLATEPRWFRVHETFTENSPLASDIIKTLVENLQGQEVDENSIVLTMKHFPGGGPQFLGFDPHYIAGQHQTYPGGEATFKAHLEPFKVAIDSGVAAIMPYYGIVGGGEWSINNPDGKTNLDAGGVPLSDLVSDEVKDTKRVPYNGYSTNVGSPAGNVGVAFSKGILDDLLRKELGFDGVINSDTGIIGDKNPPKTDYQVDQNNRAWGLQDKVKREQIQIAIEAGTDVFSGFNSNAEVRELVESGDVSESRIDESVKRLLKVQFELGLFENPYVNAELANSIVGNEAHQEKARLAQRKAVVLLKNDSVAKGNDTLLPLPSVINGKKVNLFTMGVNTDEIGEHSLTITKGDDSKGAKVANAADSDYALIRVRVTNKDTGMLLYGGANFDQVNALDFTTLAQSSTWDMSPSLEDIKKVMKEVGADKTVLSIYFRQPFVLDEASGMQDAGAILATFGSRDAALMDVVTGKFNPTGKLPFALAKSAEQIIEQASDAEGYPDENGKDASLYPFGHGLSYAK
ncbi:glycoside hydrolase family 3 protein [Vibrio scophthalmi]|uniref:beta-glucosidase n=1 Tax=Vibrio scophthalmi LMG 19158 TaxID=870967 RepID=F9RTS9_9VIBR|nr:glycoside hydrolase family 3 N-terminal domain-containing protein [Vibrio scophthalmi]EGU30845.1 glycoside hydrolase family 3 protein [Vibrio scophthalmi LMG 19158]